MSEYYQYRLFEKHTLAECARFVGWREEERIDRELNDRAWWAVANDKLLFLNLMHALQVPFPAVRAVFDRRGRGFQDAPVLVSEAELRAFLSNPQRFPLFLKPVHGTYGRGTFSLIRYCAQRDAVTLADDDEERPLDDILRAVEPSAAHGYLLTEVLTPHPQIERQCGPRLCSLRIVVRNDGAPRVVRAVWKVLVGRNISDNFVHGRSGNLLASLDIGTGRVKRIVRGVGLELEEVTVHPDTGASLAGFQLPDWAEACAMCLRAARALPGLGLQHWDVALCPAGPVAIEVNVQGSLDMHQIADGRGFLEPPR